MIIYCAILDSWVMSIDVCTGISTCCYYQSQSDKMRVLIYLSQCVSHKFKNQEVMYFHKDKRK